MGDILDRLVDENDYLDIEHDWYTENPPTSEEEWLEKQHDQMAEPFLQDGMSLIKQAYPYKGIRYGGKSSLDQKLDLFNGLNMSLSQATRNEQQDILNKLVAEVFDGKNADGSNDSGTAGVNGDAYDITNSTVITKEQFIELLTKCKGGERLKTWQDQIYEASQTWKINPLWSLAQSAKETGYWTSDAFKDLNNVGGLSVADHRYADSGTPGLGKVEGRDWEKFASPGDSFNAKMWLLRARYVDKGQVKAIDIIAGVADKDGVFHHGYCPAAKSGRDKGNNPEQYVKDVNSIINTYCEILKIDPTAEDLAPGAPDPSQIKGSTTFGANAMAYGCPREYGGKKWMEGSGRSGIHVEFDAALKSAEAAMKTEAGLSKFSGFSGFRSYQEQYNMTPGGKGATGKAPAGSSAHNVGYAADIGNNGHQYIGGPISTSSPKQKWMHANAARFGIYFPLLHPHNSSSREVWHAQLHPDLAYTLLHRAKERGLSWGKDKNVTTTPVATTDAQPRRNILK